MSITRAITICSLIGSILAAATLTYFLSDGKRAVRVRNALIATTVTTDELSWTPDKPPVYFRQDSGLPPAGLSKAVSEASLTGDDALTKALSVARHLLPSDKRGKGLKSDSFSTYKLIVSEGRGYCADYTQVFGAISQIANLAVREWGMSFDEFSGDGHAFSEVYSPELQKWIFVDIFFSFIVVDIETKTPLSAAEYFALLEQGNFGEYAIIDPIDRSAFVFGSQEKAVNYYSKGASQRFLWLGNNTFEMENNPMIRAAGRVSRSAEQFVAILLGIHPKIGILESEENRQAIQRLQTYKRVVVTTLTLLIVCSSVLTIYVARLAWTQLRNRGLAVRPT